MDDFEQHLKAQAAKEIPGETLAEAMHRARLTGKRVNWQGHYVDQRGNLTAYNH